MATPCYCIRHYAVHLLLSSALSSHLISRHYAVSLRTLWSPSGWMRHYAVSTSLRLDSYHALFILAILHDELVLIYYLPYWYLLCLEIFGHYDCSDPCLVTDQPALQNTYHNVPAPAANNPLTVDPNLLTPSCRRPALTPGLVGSNAEMDALSFT